LDLGTRPSPVMRHDRLRRGDRHGFRIPIRGRGNSLFDGDLELSQARWCLAPHDELGGELVSVGLCKRPNGWVVLLPQNLGDGLNPGTLFAERCSSEALPNERVMNEVLEHPSAVSNQPLEALAALRADELVRVGAGWQRGDLG